MSLTLKGISHVKFGKAVTRITKFTVAVVNTFSGFLTSKTVNTSCFPQNISNDYLWTNRTFYKLWYLPYSASLNKQKEIVSYVTQITTIHLCFTETCAVHFPNYRNKKINYSVKSSIGA